MTTGIPEIPLKHFRANVSRTSGAAISDDGGEYGHGYITGLSVITRGEASGHDMWIDADFLSDVTAAGNAANSGLKARFTHPGQSSDGLGTYLGKYHNFRTEGDRVVADLHFQESASNTPDGDLAAYVRQLAADAPDAFGVSIVFDADVAAMEMHQLENTQGGRFVSPDEDNRNNYQHARLSRLRAADVVDDPAANPDGLFHKHAQIAQDADGLFEYAFGLTGDKPNLVALSVDGDRIKAAVDRFLSRHDLSLVKGSEQMPEAPAAPVETPEVPAVTRESFNAELQRYVTAFGDAGAAWFIAGKSFEDCQAEQLSALREQLEAARAENAELQARIDAVQLGEEQPEEFGDDTGEHAPEKAKNLRAGFANRIRINGASHN
jgi:hypothetical protein